MKRRKQLALNREVWKQVKQADKEERARKIERKRSSRHVVRVIGEKGEEVWMSQDRGRRHFPLKVIDGTKICGRSKEEQERVARQEMLQG